MAPTPLPETQELLQTLSGLLSVPHEWLVFQVNSKTETVKLLVESSLRFQTVTELAGLLASLGHTTINVSEKDIVFYRAGTKTLKLQIKPRSVVNTAADLYEVAIVQGINAALNNNYVQDEITDQYKAKLAKTPGIQDTGRKLAEKLIELQPNIISAVHYGKTDAELTAEWKSTADDPTKLDTTPKTDFILYAACSDPLRVSLKKGRSSQLMSGGKQEALATVAAVGRGFPGAQATINKILDNCRSFGSGKIPIEFNTLLRINPNDDTTDQSQRGTESAPRKAKVATPRRNRTSKSVQPRRHAQVSKV